MDSPPAFGALLDKHLQTAGLSQREFAKLAGISGGHPANLMAGKRTPALDKIEEMAGILRLSKEEADEFFLAALLAHSPPGIPKLVESLRRKLAKAEQQNALLVKQQALILAELRRAGVPVPKQVGDG